MRSCIDCGHPLDGDTCDQCPRPSAVSFDPYLVAGGDVDLDELELTRRYRQAKDFRAMAS